MGSGDRAGRFTDYYPAWIDNLAEDVTIEGSLLDGAAQGAEAARIIVGTIRTLYEHQDFNFAGPVEDNGWLEDYTAHVRGEPIGCVVLVTRNATGHAQHIAANYRPRSSLLLLSRLVAEKLAGTPPECAGLPKRAPARPSDYASAFSLALWNSSSVSSPRSLRLSSSAMSSSGDGGGSSESWRCPLMR